MASLAGLGSSCALALLVAAGTAHAAEWRIPPIAGELAGDFKSLRLGDGATLHWRATARDVGEGRRELSGTIDGPGARVRISAVLDASANGTWRIEDAEVDLREWYGEIIAWTLHQTAKFNVTGTLRVTGDGVVRDGVLHGGAVFALRNGRFEIADRKAPVLLDGITLDLAFEDLFAARTAPSQQLTWTGGHYGPVALGAGKLRFALNGDRAEVESASVAVFAGELTLDAFSFSFAQPEFDAPAHVHDFEMAMLLPYLPNVVADARGRLDGSLTLRWDGSDFVPGKGALALRTGEKAEIRFLPQPGFLNGMLPASVTKVYTGLADLEQGKVPLRADALSIVLTPGGDAEGRTAVINVAGGPADPRLRAPLDLTFNVHGPLDQLFKFGMKL